jgi:hypothetical protein
MDGFEVRLLQTLRPLRLRNTKAEGRAVVNRCGTCAWPRFAEGQALGWCPKEKRPVLRDEIDCHFYLNRAKIKQKKPRGKKVIVSVQV